MAKLRKTLGKERGLEHGEIAMNLPFTAYQRIVSFLMQPLIFKGYFKRDVGKEYGISGSTKLRLFFRMAENTKRIPTASSWSEHIVMATKILEMPRSVKGAVVECGCYKGGSTANLSLICRECGRELVVFDSFEGLPEPSSGDRDHLLIEQKHIYRYSKGDWAGGLDEVRGNVSRYGDPSVCTYRVGFFEKTLPEWTGKCAFVFLDVDLLDSLKTCIEYLWPLLQDGCCLFTHEAKDLRMASLFFDRDWWSKTLHCEPPGLIGAGSGLGLELGDLGFGSAVGYTVKNPEFGLFKTVEKSGM
jgi:hypothetical protein